ncbi:MAG: hypothetical protein MUF42_06225 [Cytophagaceae bacterium]|jgi:hypothetical protein|nr:hypothetical protein [Cytophagaceae bacterium]
MKKVIFGIIVLFLSLPFLQSMTGTFSLRPLSGHGYVAPDTVFTWKKWWDGTFQIQREKYINDNFGFRNLFIRGYNEISYNLFNKLNLDGGVVGKENYLYEQRYLDAYYGVDFLGDEIIKEKVRKIKRIQDTLQKLNKFLLIVLAPGKGSFYPEYFPDELKRIKGPTNNESYENHLKEQVVHHIDFNTHFCNIKKTSSHSLYPKYGIHWSSYGATLAADSIISYLNKNSYRKMQRFNWHSVVMKKSNLYDNDMGDAANLLITDLSDSSAYPVLEEVPGDYDKISTLVISDSFYWTLASIGLEKRYSKFHFLYYNKQKFPENMPVDPTDLYNFTNESDVVLIISTEATIKDLGWGAIEKMYNFYFSDFTDPELRTKIIEMQNYIRADKNWSKAIAEKANKEKVSFDSILFREAKWEVDRFLKHQMTK